jgi:large subunit ribosomal protein L9
MSMQIILMEKIHNLGQLGDIVKVKDGFARNFLIPQGKARRATEKAIAEFQQRRAELEAAQGKSLAQAQERATKLDGLMIQITQKAGVDGRLFGSVTNYDIAETLKTQGHDVTKSMVRLPQGPLKQVGDFPITLDLHADVTATITVSVLGEAAS